MTFLYGLKRSFLAKKKLKIYAVAQKCQIGTFSKRQDQALVQIAAYDLEIKVFMFL